MKAISVTLIYLIALLASPAGIIGWQWWLFKVLIIIWAIILQSKLLEKERLR